MKVELVVLQNGAEGKRIAMSMPVFRIGRGETCHLRPNSERVSREHAEFSIKNDLFQVKDLGSRNGTLVNGKPIETTVTLVRGDHVTVGPLEFVVAYDGVTAPEAATAPAAAEKPKAAAPADDIASWLLGDDKKTAAEAPSVYGGDTITITAFRAGQGEVPASSGITEAAKMSDQGFERQSEEPEAEEAAAEEFMDEDNPFFVKKPEAPVAASPSTEAKKEMYKDTADAASAILRKLMERKKEDD